MMHPLETSLINIMANPHLSLMQHIETQDPSVITAVRCTLQAEMGWRSVSYLKVYKMALAHLALNNPGAQLICTHMSVIYIELT